MLPDYPKTKKKLLELAEKKVEEAGKRRLGTFNQVKVTIFHEGNKCELHREDGSIEILELQEIEATGLLEFSKHNIEDIQHHDVDEMLNAMGEKLAEKKKQQFLEKMDEAVESVGNVVDSSLPTVEQLFAGMENMIMNFDRNDKPILPKFIFGSPEQAQKFEAASCQITNDSKLNLRYKNIIDKKRTEWRDREAARNLVE